MEPIRTSDSGWQSGSGWQTGKRNRRTKSTSTKHSPKTTIVIGILLFIIATIVNIDSYMDYTKETRIAATGEQTPGVVSNVEFREKLKRNTSSSSNNREKRSYSSTVTVEYTTLTGSTQTLQKKFSITRGQFFDRTGPVNLGDSVTVSYDRDKPSDAVVKGWIEKPFIPMLAGGIFAFVSIGIIVSGIRASKKKSATVEE